MGNKLGQKPPTFKHVELAGPKHFPEISRFAYSRLIVGDPLILLREPDNKVDHLAILVCTGAANSRPIAYIQRPINFELARWIDKGWPYLAQVTHLYAGRFGRHLATAYPLGSTEELTKTTEEVILEVITND